MSSPIISTSSPPESAPSPQENEKNPSDETGDFTDHGDMGDDMPSSMEDDPSESHDEVEEARRVAEKETRHLRIWRFVVTDTIIMIAVVLILTTYTVQREAEHIRFADAFEQFATSIADHVEQQQQVLVDTLLEFSTVVSTSAELVSNPWPLFTLPHLETNAERLEAVAGLQYLGVFSKVDKEENRPEWVSFAQVTHEDIVQNNNAIAGTLDELEPVGYHPYMTRVSAETGEIVQDWARDFYFPALAWSPPPQDFSTINWNMASDHGFRSALESFMFVQEDNGQPSSQDVLYTFPDDPFPLLSTAMQQEPLTYVLTPIYQTDVTNTTNTKFVGVVSSAFTWDAMLTSILGSQTDGILAVITSPNCGKTFSYVMSGGNVTYVGPFDNHDEQFNVVAVNLTLSDNSSSIFGGCAFEMSLYPTDVFWNEYVTFRPEAYAMIVFFLFFSIVIVYFVYDKLVDSRNEKLIARFARSNAIVSSLFPRQIQERLMAGDDNDEENSKGGHSLKEFMTGGGGGGGGGGATAFRSSNAIGLIGGEKPLADLFPNTSIMFADLSGFTAWSSVREPSQVFMLLETLYSSFDEVAAARRIFKVETVGDCYVAAAGLPNPRRDHAQAIVRFAFDIMEQVQVLTKRLEVVLGPDTGDLSLRIGIHSGPVTAGILRGKKARFQLFGDTMNTCSRLETTGTPGRIHCSQATADLLIRAKKKHWVQKRQEMVAAKGKGVIQTYWVTPQSSDGRSTTSSGSSGSRSGSDSQVHQHNKVKKVLSKSGSADALSDRVDRLVEWNVGALLNMLRKIIARREAQNEAAMVPMPPGNWSMESSTFPLDEVKETIVMPEFNNDAAGRQRSPGSVEIPPLVVDQLRLLVRKIASMYRQNNFHSFEHASHVTMSVTKLLSRIVAPSEQDMETGKGDGNGNAFNLHDHTYGITSDPLTQFACIFSALIHDVDHTGVPNAQLVKEGADIAAYYKNRSVAEQNSFDLSWALFMDSSFDAVRAQLCATPSELRHFREIVINCVMATDIVDKDLKQLRNGRWEKAFATGSTSSEDEDANSSSNRKATIVLEHLIQASDVAHTMQHWHIYRKWNERFFLECYQAYKEGRAAGDPSEYWYKGEIGFFDFYIIPLAKKLKDCGVFGVSSDEYLVYAQNNRDEWESRGRDIVAEFVAKAEQQFGNGDDACRPVNMSTMSVASNEDLHIDDAADEE